MVKLLRAMQLKGERGDGEGYGGRYVMMVS